ncbi:MAG: sortase [Caldilineaceae bacterium]|nr:sortase [Caldilineaceae bacterium]
MFVLLVALLLSGCSTGDSKQVIRVRVRSNRVEAQSPQNQFRSDIYAPGLLPTATPLAPATPPPTATAAAQVENREVPPPPTPVLPPRPTPTPAPIVVPIGRPDRIVIPSIQVDTQVLTVESQPSQIGNQWFDNWQTAAFAAGFHDSSALLGQEGNTVISGHNNIDGSVFQDLYQLQPGEIVQLYAGGYRYDYVIEDQFIVRERDVPVEQRVQNASWIRTTVDERVTLVSCWPPTGNEFRVIVVARPLSQMAGSSVSGSN